MRTIGHCLFSLAVLVWVVPATASAQVPPDEDWRQFETTHFVVTFPASLDAMAGRAAERAERAFEHLSGRLGDPPGGRVQLLLTDHVDQSNGFASPTPYNRITIYLHPPLEGENLSYYDDWLELVITHELVHTFHMEMKGTLGTLTRAILGRAPMAWPVFPSRSTPTWVAEGLATFYESHLTASGRAAGTWQEMVVRTAKAEAEFPSTARVAGESQVWPSGNRPYVFGSMFLAWLEDRHGEERVAAFADALARQWVPFRLDAAMHDAVGLSYYDEWAAWERHVATDVSARVEAGGLTPLETLDDAGRLVRSPVVHPDGSLLAWTRSDGRDQTQIRVSSLDGDDGRQVSRLNGVSTVRWTPDGDLVFDQIEFVDPYRQYSDLYRVSVDGTVNRLTKGARLSQPDVSPDGGRAVATKNGQGQTRLVIVDLETGKEQVLSPTSSTDNWAFGRWSPDGSRIAAIRWQPGGYMDVVVLDLAGEVVAVVTSDRAVDATPAWSPDGAWLVWVSDRTGVANVFAAPADDLSEQGVVQVTNVLGGLAHPAVGPDGNLYVASYHSDGWHVERTPFSPDRFFPPMATDSRFSRGPSRSAGEQLVNSSHAVDSGPYSAWGTLLPRYWIPVWAPEQTAIDQSEDVRTGVRPSIGLSTGGVDLVGRHAYALSGMVSFDGRFSGAGGYAYRGFGNPTLGLSASQVFDAEPRTVGVQFPDSSVQEFLLISRERQASGSLDVVRRRSRNAVSLSLRGGFLRENLFLEDFEGEPGPTLARPRPETTFFLGRTTLAFSTLEGRPFSTTPTDGMSAWVSGGMRKAVDLDSAEEGVLGLDRSRQDVFGELTAFRSISGPGYGRHVIAVRASGGRGFGVGSDRGHFDVGGAEGVQNVFGTSLLFPIRGYRRDRRIGNRAWSASLEYRFPLAVVDRTLGSMPLFFDRLGGTLFLDAGNAWGPEGVNQAGNPVGVMPDPLMAVGGEFRLRLTPLYLSGLDARFGVGVPLVDGDGARVYLRLGRSF